MDQHPHKRWASQYPTTEPAKITPVRIAKRYYLKANRLYARTLNLFIRRTHLPPQGLLNDREVQLQEYLQAERPTRGNGSPIHSNPQQVFTFSATDDVPINTVLDDFTGLVDPLPVDEHHLASVMIPSIAPQTVNPYQRMVDRSHRMMMQTLLGGSPDVDKTTLFRMERRLTAQGF